MVPKMTPTIQGDNVILTYQTSFYTLKIEESKYEWLKIPNQLTIFRYYHVQLLVPASTIPCQGMLPLVKFSIFIKYSKALTIANLHSTGTLLRISSNKTENWALLQITSFWCFKSEVFRRFKIMQSNDNTKTRGYS